MYSKELPCKAFTKIGDDQLMFSYGENRMKYVSLAMAVMSFSVFADPRIELDTNVCHFVYDRFNSGNEHKVACAGDLREVANTGAVEGWARVEFSNVPEQYAPDNVLVNSNNSNANCELVNDDGQEYTVEEWVTEISSECQITGRCTVVYETLCGTSEL